MNSNDEILVIAGTQREYQDFCNWHVRHIAEMYRGSEQQQPRFAYWAIYDIEKMQGYDSVAVVFVGNWFRLDDAAKISIFVNGMIENKLWRLL